MTVLLPSGFCARRRLLSHVYVVAAMFLAPNSGTYEWLSLSDGSIIDGVPRPDRSSRVSTRGYPTSMCYDGDALVYLINPSTGFIDVVDIVAQRLLHTVDLPFAHGGNPSSPFNEHSAALSVDGSLLYVTDGTRHASTGGIYVYDTKTLTLRDRWLSSNAFDGVAVSPDGSTVVAKVTGADTAVVVDSRGVVAGAVNLPATAFAFV